MANIKLNTRFGELNIDDSQVITFPAGLPGFENNKRWTLFHEVDDHGNMVGGVVVHLQSIDDEKLSLPLTDPNLFGFNFELELSDEEAADLKIEDPTDVLVLTTLSIKDVVPKTGDAIPPENMFTNISAPILINVKSHTGMQKVLIGKNSKIDFRATVLL